MNQQTLKSEIKFSGVGVHSGIVANVVVKPAEPNSGIVFVRTDLENGVIDSGYKNVCDTRLCTVIGNENGDRVSTIEHLMSAFYGMGVDNAIVEIDSEEMPIMDGSSIQFVEMIQGSGLVQQSAKRKYIKIEQEIVIEDGDKYIRFRPSNESSFNCEIEFAHKAVGKQSYGFDVDSGDYGSEVSKARTFGFAHEIEQLRAMGLARGGSLDNAIGIDENGIMNPGGFRYQNELARHKVLDMMGDLFLAGYRIRGRIEANKPGHAINNAALHKLFASDGAFSIC